MLSTTLKEENGMGGMKGLWIVCILALGDLSCLSALAAGGGLESRTSFSNRSQSAIELAVGTGLGVLRDDMGYGFNVAASVPVESPLLMRIGLELGWHHWQNPQGTDPLRSFGVPVVGSEVSAFSFLPTFVATFPLAGIQGFYPYLGLSAGPMVYLSSATSVGGNRTHEGKILGVVFLKPGVDIRGPGEWGIRLEPRFGRVGGEWTFFPQMMMNWLL